MKNDITIDDVNQMLKNKQIDRQFAAQLVYEIGQMEKQPKKIVNKKPAMIVTILPVVEMESDFF